MPKPPPRPKFPYTLPYHLLDLRAHPELYRIGLGEQGVLMVQPYKSELLPLWRFKTPAIAKTSSQALYAAFLEYKKKKDFVGCDMARKFVQMGVTRSRRYANHKGGRKYRVSEDGKEKVEMQRRGEEGEDKEKAESARVFMGVLEMIREDEGYRELEREHRRLYDGREISLEGLGVEVGEDVKVKQIEEGPRKVMLKKGRKAKVKKEEDDDDYE